MRKYLQLISWLSLFLISPRPVAAQNQEIDSLAREVLAAIDVMAQTKVMLEGSLQVMAESPVKSAMRVAFRAFYEEYLPPEVALPALVSVYTKEFTASELRGLITFYRSSLGRHLITAQPQLAMEVQQFVQGVLKTHAADLQAKIERALSGG